MLGTTDRTLRSWQSEDWWPEDGRTKSGYDIVLIREAQNAHGKTGSEHGEKMRAIRLKREEGKLEREQIDIRRRRLELEEKEGQLIPRSSLELHLATLLKELGDLFDKLPNEAGKLAGKTNKSKVKDFLLKEFNKARQRIASELESAARSADSQQESSS